LSVSSTYQGMRSTPCESTPRRFAHTRTSASMAAASGGRPRRSNTLAVKAVRSRQSTCTGSLAIAGPLVGPSVAGRVRPVKRGRRGARGGAGDGPASAAPRAAGGDLALAPGVAVHPDLVDGAAECLVGAVPGPDPHAVRPLEAWGVDDC